MRSFVGEIVILYRKNHKETFNLDKLASYVVDDDMWNQAIDRLKTINILEENYIGIWPELSDIYLKDLVKFNLLGKYASIHFSLFNFPSKDLEEKNVLPKEEVAIRLTELIKELQKKVNEEIIPIRAGVEISYLNKQEQEIINSLLDDEIDVGISGSTDGSSSLCC